MNLPRKVSVLGSTGSIGTQTLEVLARCTDAVRLHGLAVSGSRPETAAQQVLAHAPARVAIADEDAADQVAAAIRAALAPEVRVNAVCPGLISSRWFRDGIGVEGYAKLEAGYEQTAPLCRVSTPEDVAEAVVWLVDGARSVTGEIVQLDSGVHLGARVSVPGKS